MMDFIMVPAVLTICVIGVFKLFELFVCKKERIMLIEKMIDQPCLPKAPSYQLLGNFSFSALKVGCLLTGMGLGLLIGYLICYGTIPNYLNSGRDNWSIRETVSLIYGACVLSFGGIGLIAAFITELKLNKK